MVTVTPLQLDRPDTMALMIAEEPAGFGLSANEGFPEHKPGTVVVGAVVVTEVVVIEVEVDDVDVD